MELQLPAGVKPQGIDKELWNKIWQQRATLAATLLSVSESWDDAQLNRAMQAADDLMKRSIEWDIKAHQ